MSTEYVGSVILYLGANEVEVTKIDVKDNTGKKPVKTMNRTRRVKGFTRGVGQYDITFTAVVPTDGTAVDWAPKSAWFPTWKARARHRTSASAPPKRATAIPWIMSWW